MKRFQDTKRSLTTRNISYKPSPVTMSPSLKLCLVFKTDFNNGLNFCTPLIKAGVNLLLFPAMFSSILGSADGGGSWNASNPEKNRRMLSATFWAELSLDPFWSWKTCIRFRENIRLSFRYRSQDRMSRHVTSRHACHISSYLLSCTSYCFTPKCDMSRLLMPYHKISFPSSVGL